MATRLPRLGSSARAWLILLAILALASLAIPDGLLAQAPQQGPREMRHFWHVFIAYAAAWILLLGWVASIVRRLRRVEEKLH